MAVQPLASIWIKMGVPQNHPFIDAFPTTNQPAIGDPASMEPRFMVNMVIYDYSHPQIDGKVNPY